MSALESTGEWHVEFDRPRKRDHRWEQTDRRKAGAVTAWKCSRCSIRKEYGYWGPCGGLWVVHLFGDFEIHRGQAYASKPADLRACR